MNKKFVKNISEMDQTVVGIGVVKVDETVEVNEDFYNANFEETKKVVEKPLQKKSKDEE